MTYMKWGKFLFRLNILFYFVYNTYFGWNYEAVEDLEYSAEFLFKLINCVAIYLYLYPIILYYEFFIERLMKEQGKKNN